LTRVICAGLFAGLVAGAPLDAAPKRKQKTEEFRFGAGVQLVSPSGDIADTVVGPAKMGFGLSVFGEMNLNPNMALRGRIDYNAFGEGEDRGVKVNIATTTVFVDYIYAIDSVNEGLYLFGGLGMVSTDVEWSAGGVTADWKDISGGGDSGGLGFTIGAGFNFNKNFGGEVSLVQASGNLTVGGGSSKTYDSNWLQIAVKYRF